MLARRNGELADIMLGEAPVQTQNSSRRWRVPLVLVVEDHPVVSDTVCGLLTDLGYATRAAPTLAAAREFLLTYLPDCVVLDVMLPDGDALELLFELTSVQAAPPTVVMSAAPRARNLATNFGVPFVEKPLDHEHFVAAVQVAIDGRITPVHPRQV